MRHLVAGARTIRDYLERRAQDDPERVAYHFVSYQGGGPSETTLSYGALRDGARALAGALQARGLAPGDRVMIPSLQMASDLIGAFGCIYAGLPFILLPPPVDAGKATRFRAAIESAEPALVLTSAVLNHVMGGVEKLAGAVIRRIAVFELTATPEAVVPPP